MGALRLPLCAPEAALSQGQRGLPRETDVVHVGRPRTTVATQRSNTVVGDQRKQKREEEERHKGIEETDG